MNTILCATDLSEASSGALKWCFDQARKTNAKVVVMFCYRLIPRVDNEETLDLKRRMESDAKSKFQELEKKYLISNDVQYSFITEVGFYHLRIEVFLRSNSVGLLGISNSVVQNFDEYKNLGFEAFLKNIKIPVVVIPQELEEPVHTHR